MTTFEKWNAMKQIIENLEGLRRDMRSNASAYISAVSDGNPLAEVIAVVRGDADEYLRRLTWISTIPASIRAELLSFCSLIGLDGAELTNLYVELKRFADQQQIADLTTGPKIIAAANNLRNNLLDHFRLW